MRVAQLAFARAWQFAIQLRIENLQQDLLDANALLHATEDARSAGEALLGPLAQATAHCPQEQDNILYFVDNSNLQASTLGLEYLHSSNLSDRVSGQWATWNTYVRGRPVAKSGYVSVGELFLPERLCPDSPRGHGPRQVLVLVTMSEAVERVKRGVRDVLVLRCWHSISRPYRHFFLTAAEEALGVGSLDIEDNLPLKGLILLAYDKVLGKTEEAFVSNGQIQALRRGKGRARRKDRASQAPEAQQPQPPSYQPAQQGEGPCSQTAPIMVPEMEPMTSGTIAQAPQAPEAQQPQPPSSQPAQQAEGPCSQTAPIMSREMEPMTSGTIHRDAAANSDSNSNTSSERTMGEVVLRLEEDNRQMRMQILDLQVQVRCLLDWDETCQ